MISLVSKIEQLGFAVVSRTSLEISPWPFDETRAIKIDKTNHLAKQCISAMNTALAPLDGKVTEFGWDPQVGANMISFEWDGRFEGRCPYINVGFSEYGIWEEMEPLDIDEAKTYGSIPVSLGVDTCNNSPCRGHDSNHREDVAVKVLNHINDLPKWLGDNVAKAFKIFKEHNRKNH
jgi:hypothetical protein